MRADVTEFKDALRDKANPRWVRKVGCVYVGTAYVLRADGLRRAADLYIRNKPDHVRKWIPEMLTVCEDGDYVWSINNLSRDIDCTDNQWALFYLRDYINTNWWPLILGM